MDDFEEKLNSILSSPEAMGQIMALANSLSGQMEGDKTTAAEPDSSPAAPVAPVAPVAPAATSSPPAVPAANPLAMLQNLDPAVLGTVGTLFQEYNRGDDEKAALLQALRPFLREERRAKVDRAVQITRLSRVIRTALRLFREAGHV